MSIKIHWNPIKHFLKILFKKCNKHAINMPYLFKSNKGTIKSPWKMARYDSRPQVPSRPHSALGPRPLWPCPPRRFWTTAAGAVGPAREEWRWKEHSLYKCTLAYASIYIIYRERESPFIRVHLCMDILYSIIVFIYISYLSVCKSI